MNILVIYASTEGQTAKIARFVLSKLVEMGHSAALVHARDFGDLDVADFDAVIAAASLHAGRYQSEFEDVVTAHASAITERPNLFLSVSLSAAGVIPEDWQGLERGVRDFCEKTGWTPDRVEHVAGAIRFSEYDFFKYWAMRWIESKRDSAAEPGTDREYTDWAALADTLRDWTGSLENVT